MDCMGIFADDLLHFHFCALRSTKIIYVVLSKIFFYLQKMEGMRNSEVIV